MKPYQCKICDVRFTQRNTLMLHKKAVHDGKKYTCKICDKSFSFKTNLTRHIKSEKHFESRDVIKEAKRAVAIPEFYSEEHFETPQEGHS